MGIKEPGWVEYLPVSKPETGRRVVLVSGDEEYRSEESMPMLGRMLAERHGFACSVHFAVDPSTGEIDPGCQTNIPGLERLEGADVMVLATRFRELPDEQMRHIVEFTESGGAVIGLRTATHAFCYDPASSSQYARFSFDSTDPEGGYGRHVLGETWVDHHGHHGEESTRGVTDDANAEHPILRGVSDVWGPSDVYMVRTLEGSPQVLLHGKPLDGMTDDAAPTDKPTMPVAWVRTDIPRGPAKMFCTTMGAAVDFANEDVRRLVVNAVYWCAGLEGAISPDLDVSPVGDYSPTMFGFGSFQSGLRPAHFAQ